MRELCTDPILLLPLKITIPECSPTISTARVPPAPTKTCQWPFICKTEENQGEVKPDTEMIIVCEENTTRLVTILWVNVSSRIVLSVVDIT